MKEVVSHKGKVVSVSDTNVFVKIERGGSCVGCKNKGSCQMGESEEQIISVRTDEAKAYFAGEDVNVLMRASLGLKAVLYAYIIPLVFLLITFIVVRQFITSELIQILLAFIPVVVYYVILYKMRDKMDKTFQFYISKIRFEDQHFPG